jgi:long-chain fatty acid transport protein
MQNNFRKLLISFIALTTPTLLLAGGFQSNDLSPRLQGQAMAGGGADAGDVTTIFINPAILSTIMKPEVYVGASYDAPHLSMKNASAQHGQFSGAGIVNMLPVTGTSTSQTNVTSAKILPTFYAAMPLNHGFTYGISFTSPWAYHTNYDAGSVVRYMAQKTNITSYNLSGLLSYAVNNQLSFAAGIQGQYLEAEVSNFDGAADGASATTQASTAGADNVGLGYILGALYSPSEATHVGVSYRSKVDYQLHGSGEQYLLRGPQASTAKCTSKSSSTFNNCHSNVQMGVTTPSVLNMSLIQQLTPQWQLDFTTQVTFWSGFKGINVKTPDAYIIDKQVATNWQNAALFSVGSNYQLDTHWILRGGVGYDETPTIANTRDARMPDNNKILAAIGATYQFNQHLRIDASYEHAFMEGQHLNSSINDGEQRGFPDADIPAPATSPYQANQVTADYSGSADIVALGLNYLF